MTTSINGDVQTDVHTALLAQLKREVKHTIEEASAKRYIYEDGGLVVSLCVAIEACLSHGLKKRVFGLFGSPSTFALLHKISSLCPPAASIVKMVIQIEQAQYKLQKSATESFENKRGSFSGAVSSPVCRHPTNCRYLWIRLALLEKVLLIIVDYIRKNASKFYENDALMRETASATMLSDLLAGLNALEFSKMKTMDHYWTDPPAEELLQRHRIHSHGGSLYVQGCISPKSPRPTLQVKRAESLGPDDLIMKLSASAREYVMSLHQNTRATLLYGKNGVIVCPTTATRPMRGYLSLHQNFDGTLIIKWLPNELVHSGSDPVLPYDIWKYALKIDLHNIVYLHYHHAESGGKIVFVAADGVQYPPIQFPSGQHPLAFLSCLENGMATWGYLDPPLWSQRGKGKILPKLKRRSSLTMAKLNDTPVPETSSDEYGDYVFRLVITGRPSSEESTPTSVSRKQKSKWAFSLKERFFSLSGSPASTPPATPKSQESQHSPTPQSPATKIDSEDHGCIKNHSASIDDQIELRSASSTSFDDSPGLHPRCKLQNACHSMRYQILSRAFYGWLANCRHLKIIRTHLAGLVNQSIISPDYPTAAWEGLTKDEWTRLRSEKTPMNKVEFYRRIYFGNMPHELRKETWPIIFGLYAWEDSKEEHLKLYESLRKRYEELLMEWASLEAIIREKDKEAFKAARSSGENHSRNVKAIVKQCSVSSDAVFHNNNDFGTPSHCDTTIDNGINEALTMESLEDLSEVQFESSMVMTNSVEHRQDIDGTDGKTTLEKDGRSETPITPEEGDGELYPVHIVEAFALNLHRIEKDVHRCDRHHPYFNMKNLDKLKNVMCTYVWENLDCGYVQGMCDLAAVLLVIFDDEVMTYGCFKQMMKKMEGNFPQGGDMEIHLANMRALLQMVDPELYELMLHNGDYTHFYFAYRWFLLDFKREFVYNDVFRVWEIIWAANHVASTEFVLFLAVATVEIYRDILLENNMDFTDVIKFFNEMAEKHDANALLDLARNLVLRLQKAVEK